jgi:lysophospholipase L1-like esterase
LAATVLGRALRSFVLLALGFVLLLIVEVLVALNGRSLPPQKPFALDRAFATASDGHDAGSPLTLVWLGDSTGAGVGASSARTALPTSVARGLGRAVQLRVLARSGAQVLDVLSEQLPLLPPLRPDIVILGVGGNDVTHLTPRRLFEGLYDSLLQGIQAVGATTVVVMGIGDFGTVPRIPQPLRAITGWRGRRLDEVVRTLAARRGAAYVDLYAETGPIFGSAPSRFYADDGFHPNDEGYRAWATAILEVLRPKVATALSTSSATSVGAAAAGSTS